jgi:hypothetical protein
VIDADKYPLSPRVRLRREVLAKFGEIGGLPAELERKLRRAVPPPATPRPPPKVYEPPSKGPVQAAVIGLRVKPRAPLSGAVAGGSGRAMPPLAATTWEPRCAGRPSAPAAARRNQGWRQPTGGVIVYDHRELVAAGRRHACRVLFNA